MSAHKCSKMVVFFDEGEMQNQIIFEVYLMTTASYLRPLTREEIIQFIKLVLDSHWDWLNVIDLKLIYLRTVFDKLGYCNISFHGSLRDK